MQFTDAEHVSSCKLWPQNWTGLHGSDQTKSDIILLNSAIVTPLTHQLTIIIVCRDV